MDKESRCTMSTKIYSSWLRRFFYWIFLHRTSMSLTGESTTLPRCVTIKHTHWDRISHLHGFSYLCPTAIGWHHLYDLGWNDEQTEIQNSLARSRPTTVTLSPACLYEETYGWAETSGHAVTSPWSRWQARVSLFATEQLAFFILMNKQGQIYEDLTPQIPPWHGV